MGQFGGRGVASGKGGHGGKPAVDDGEQRVFPGRPWLPGENMVRDPRNVKGDAHPPLRDGKSRAEDPCGGQHGLGGETRTQPGRSGQGNYSALPVLARRTRLRNSLR